jgi:hypothetical protein
MKIFQRSTEETGCYKKLNDKEHRRWQGLRLSGEVRETVVQKEDLKDITNFCQNILRKGTT